MTTRWYQVVPVGGLLLAMSAFGLVWIVLGATVVFMFAGLLLLMVLTCGLLGGDQIARVYEPVDRLRAQVHDYKNIAGSPSIGARLRLLVGFYPATPSGRLRRNDLDAMLGGVRKGKGNWMTRRLDNRLVSFSVGDWCHDILVQAERIEAQLDSASAERIKLQFAQSEKLTGVLNALADLENAVQEVAAPSVNTPSVSRDVPREATS